MESNIRSKIGVFNVRDLRAELVSLAYDAMEHGNGQVLILSNCKVSEGRLADEIARFRTLVSPQVFKRIRIITENDGGDFDLPPNITAEQMATALSHSVDIKRSAGVGQHNVLNIMLLNWLNDGEPQTIKAICESSGTSYPTAARVIKQLKNSGILAIASDRHVSLKCFPDVQWRKWINAGFEHRKSVRFADRSGQPRPPSSLLKRLSTLRRNDIALSGIPGAQFHFSNLDLTGALRLDLVFNGSHKSDLSFVERLDPALERTEDLTRKSDLVVHFLDRPETQFQRNGGFLWADPLECLADLYHAKLDIQADEMLHFLINRKKRSA